MDCFLYDGDSRHEGVDLKKASQTIYKSLSSKESYIVALFYSHIVRSSFPTSLKYTNARTTLKRMTKFIQKIKNQLAFSQT